MTDLMAWNHTCPRGPLPKWPLCARFPVAGPSTAALAALRGAVGEVLVDALVGEEASNPFYGGISSAATGWVKDDRGRCLPNADVL